MNIKKFIIALLFVVVLTNAIWLFFEFRKMQEEIKYWRVRQNYIIELIEQEKKGESDEK